MTLRSIHEHFQLRRIAQAFVLDDLLVHETVDLEGCGMAGPGHGSLVDDGDVDAARIRQVFVDGTRRRSARDSRSSATRETTDVELSAF